MEGLFPGRGCPPAQPEQPAAPSSSPARRQARPAPSAGYSPSSYAIQAQPLQAAPLQAQPVQPVRPSAYTTSRTWHDSFLHAGHRAAAATALGAPSFPQGLASESSEKKILPAFLLCTFVGVLGVHRFYVGTTGSGLAQIFTLGGMGIWSLIDWIMILCGSFRDRRGKTLSEWT